MKFYFLLLVIISLSCRHNENSDGTHFGSPNYTHYHKENRTRDAWQKPNELIKKLGNLEGKTIADIGAGTGYFTFRLAMNAKKVIAVDIDPDMIDLVEAFKVNLPASFDDKIETRLATPKNPNLKINEVDIIWMINTISYIEDKPSYLSKLYQVMPDSGQIMIADYKLSNIPINAEKGDYSISQNGLGSLLQSVGFKNISIDDQSLEYQYVVLANK